MSYAAKRYGSTRAHRRAHHGDPETQPSLQPIKRGANGKVRTRENRRKESSKSLQDEVRRDIVTFFRRRRDKFLDAMNFKDATGQLFKKLPHAKELIVKAFRQLTGGNDPIIRQEEFGYRLMALSQAT